MQAEKKLDDIEQPTLLHVLQTFYNNDQTAVGNKWANALVEHFDGDDNFVIQVKDMLAEPISDADKEKARMLNKQAVTRYKNGEYLDAISMYQDAIEISPKHPGLVLNREIIDYK